MLLAFLNFRWAARLGSWATSITSKPWLQGLCFAPVFLLLWSLFHLPLSMLGHHISLAYGQSIQGWGSWFTDWGKALLLDLISGTVVLSVVFALIRKSRRWWLWLWVISLPMEVLLVFVLPLVVDPMFNHFEPLAQSNPALVQQLERVIEKTGVSIPPARMFLMKASEKYTSSNAYVTGFGSSQRVVVWDNTIKHSPPDEILLVFGHELGHYVLHHIERGLAMGAVLSLFFLWIGSHLARYLIAPLWAAMAYRFAGRLGGDGGAFAGVDCPLFCGRAHRQWHQPGAGAPGGCVRQRGGPWHRRRPTKSECCIVPAAGGRISGVSLPFAVRCVLDLHASADRRT